MHFYAKLRSFEEFDTWLTHFGMCVYVNLNAGLMRRVIVSLELGYMGCLEVGLIKNQAFIVINLSTFMILSHTGC